MFLLGGAPNASAADNSVADARVRRSVDAGDATVVGHRGWYASEVDVCRVDTLRADRYHLNG